MACLHSAPTCEVVLPPLTRMRGQQGQQGVRWEGTALVQAGRVVARLLAAGVRVRPSLHVQ